MISVGSGGANYLSPEFSKIVPSKVLQKSSGRLNATWNTNAALVLSLLATQVSVFALQFSVYSPLHVH